MGIFSNSRQTRCLHSVQINVQAADAVEARATADALSSLSGHFTLAELQRILTKLKNPVMKAQVKTFL